MHLAHASSTLSFLLLAFCPSDKAAECSMTRLKILLLHHGVKIPELHAITEACRTLG